jgi:vanillate O-demethylase monooxygenase subunit
LIDRTTGNTGAGVSDEAHGLRCGRSINPNIVLSLRNSLEEAFNEDLAIIEAQQKVFDADPNTQLLAIGADAALTYFRWVLARRIEAEKNAARAA